MRRYLKTFAVAAIMLTLAACAFAKLAHAQAKPKLTRGTASTLLTALRALDGHDVILKDGQTKVRLPYDFANAKLLIRIADDISALEPVDRNTAKAKQDAFKVMLGKATSKECDGGDATEPVKDFALASDCGRQYLELLEQIDAQDSPVSDMLSRINANDLKLDKNEIPATVIAGLRPLLDIEK